MSNRVSDNNQDTRILAKRKHKAIYSRNYRKQNIEKCLAKEKIRRDQPINKLKMKLYNRMSKLRDLYGITVDQYDLLLQKQNGLCAICKRPPKKRSLSVDHDHITGKVRGLLCYRCNYGIGWYKDSGYLFGMTAAYLVDPPATDVLYREADVKDTIISNLNPCPTENCFSSDNQADGYKDDPERYQWRDSNGNF